MKANELRIGNWVHDPIHNERDIILSDTMFCAFLSDWKDELKPIPLTEEWLLKFGGKKDDENQTYIKMITGSDVRLYLLNGFIQRTKGAFMPLSNYQHIKYVHQLQNLYFCLTGTELKTY